MSVLSNVLIDLGTFLDEREIDWYVFGAQAVIVFGRPRQTLDVDITIDVSVDDAAGLLSWLSQAGFAPRVEDIETFVRRTRVIPVVHESSGIPVDMILAGPGLEEEFLARVVKVDVRGARIPFISPEDLIAIKILAAREKDLEDVRGIVEKQGPLLDEKRVRDVLGRMEGALDLSDLVQTFELIRRQ